MSITLEELPLEIANPSFPFGEFSSSEFVDTVPPEVTVTSEIP